MEWIHCNKCYVKFENNIKLSLTECGHLFCESCLLKIKETKMCSVCNKSSINSMTLSKDMDFSVQQFFMPFDTILKKTLEIFNFQHQHRTRMMQMMYQKYLFAKKECINAQKFNNKLQHDNQMLRSMLQSRGQSGAPFATSTPVVHADISALDKQSITSSDRRNVDTSGFRPTIFTPQNTPGGVQRGMTAMYRRMMPNQHRIYSSGSSHSPSPAQRVPMDSRNQGKQASLGTASSLAQFAMMNRRRP